MKSKFFLSLVTCLAVLGIFSSYSIEAKHHKRHTKVQFNIGFGNYYEPQALVTPYYPVQPVYIAQPQPVVVYPQYGPVYGAPYYQPYPLYENRIIPGYRSQYLEWGVGVRIR